MTSLDPFDRAIIAALQDDARMPVAQIAERVSLSATQITLKSLVRVQGVRDVKSIIALEAVKVPGIVPVE